MAREQERCPCWVAAVGNVEITVTVERAALLNTAHAARRAAIGRPSVPWNAPITRTATPRVGEGAT